MFFSDHIVFVVTESYVSCSLKS